MLAYITSKFKRTPINIYELRKRCQRYESILITLTTKCTGSENVIEVSGRQIDFSKDASSISV